MFVLNKSRISDLICSALRQMSKFRRKAENTEKLLRTETELSTELMKKNSNRFRNDHGHKSVKMTLKCVNRYLEADVSKSVMDFEENFPRISEFLTSTPNSNYYLPSLEMCEFLLSRLSGIFALLVKICQVYCLKSGDLALKRIRLGHFWTVGLNNLAATAKICQLSVNLAAEIQILYSKIRPLLAVMNCPREFPRQIGQNLMGENSWLKLELDKIFESQRNSDIKRDAGLIVEREIIPVKEPDLPCKKDHWLQICSTFNSINDADQLLKFSENEHLKRKKERKSCASKLMDKTSWKEMKMFIAMKCPKLKNKEMGNLKERIVVWMLYPDSRGDDREILDLWKNQVKRNLVKKYKIEIN